LFVITACLRTQLNLFDVDLARWIQRVAPRPLLLIFGEQDVIVSPSEVDMIFARAHEPKEVWRVPEAAHRDIYVRRPDEYRQRICEFFEKNL
ncbi:MAG TPA: alpha/beta hydrolase, partial [Anaerolineae bacterium]|nr:alpha/beta hydrolase [Anaerolineae bacterium]